MTREVLVYSIKTSIKKRNLSKMFLMFKVIGEIMNDSSRDLLQQGQIISDFTLFIPHSSILDQEVYHSYNFYSYLTCMVIFVVFLSYVISPSGPNVTHILTNVCFLLVLRCNVKIFCYYILQLLNHVANVCALYIFEVIIYNLTQFTTK